MNVCESSTKKRGFRQTPFGANSKREKEVKERQDIGTSTKMSAVIVDDITIKNLKSSVISAVAYSRFSISSLEMNNRNPTDSDGLKQKFSGSTSLVGDG